MSLENRKKKKVETLIRDLFFEPLRLSIVLLNAIKNIFIK